MFVIAVRDLAIQAFMQPGFVNHTGAAVRAFSDHCKDSNSEFSKHPEDFELFVLAEFDDATGRFTQDEPIRLARAIDFVVVTQ